MAGTIKLRHQVALANNPAYDISANIWNDSLVVAGGSHGDLMQRDTGATDGWSLVTPAYEPTITTLAVNKGGTGIASYAVGDLLYASGATTLAKRAVGAAGTVLVGGTTPDYSATPSVTSLTASTALVVGTNPAAAGAIRLANNQGIYARNAANTADYHLLHVDSVDMYIGDAALSGQVVFNKRMRAGGRIATGEYLLFDTEWFGAPPIPGADGAILITNDNGAGKTQLLVQFSSGSPIVLATQP